MPSQTDVPITEPSQKLFDAIKNKNLDEVVQFVCDCPDFDLNCVDENELSPLQHACHTGDVQIARFLINNGAKVDYTQRKDRYTPLMFAAISSRSDVVRLLLERGADITLENCVNRTAAQMAAFVGQTKIVSIISNWIPYGSSIEPYTRRRELEDKARIPKEIGPLLHEYVVLPSSHPVKFLLFIKEHMELVKYGSSCLYVLENLSSKSLKPPINEESLSFKYHYLTYLLEYCFKACKSGLNCSDKDMELSFDKEACSKIIENIIRRLIRRSDPKEVLPCTLLLDRFIIEAIMKFPYTQTAIFKTMTFALSKTEAVDLKAFAILTQTLNGPRMFGHSAEACSICAELDKNKKCSKCKKVYYCSTECQKADWFQHKKTCKSPEEQPLLAEEKEATD